MFATLGFIAGACGADNSKSPTGMGEDAGAGAAGGTDGTAGSSGAPGTAGSAGEAGVTGRGGSGPGGASGNSAGTGGSGAAGVAGGSGGAGSGGNGGDTGAGGISGSGGATSTGGQSGTAGSAGAGGSERGGAGGTMGRGGATGGASGPFVCNQVTGGKLTEEWFIAGFENVVANARWQVKWREDGYVEEWANPQSAFWNAPVDSACASSTTSPDRVVFGAVTWKYKTQTEFRAGITQAVNTFKMKYPNLRRIDLVTQIRGPNNMACPTPPTPGEPIAVPAIQDAAMEEVAAAFPGFVFVGPKVQAHSCSEFQGGGPHLTSAGNMANVGALSDYFAQIQ